MKKKVLSGLKSLSITGQIVNYDSPLRTYKGTISIVSNFPEKAFRKAYISSPGEGRRRVKFGLFDFKRMKNRDQAIAKMEEAGFRPATTKELLSYIMNNLKKKKDKSIFALNAIANMRGEDFTIYLEKNGELTFAGWTAYHIGRYLGVKV